MVSTIMCVIASKASCGPAWHQVGSISSIKKAMAKACAKGDYIRIIRLGSLLKGYLSGMTTVEHGTYPPPK